MLDNIEEFRIIFENSAAVFSAGHDLSGKVVLKLSAPCQIRSVSLTITGKGQVSFKSADKKGNPKNVHRESIILSDKWAIFETASAVPIGSSKKHKKSCPQGISEFEFRRKLPSGLPTSFDGNQGHIRFVLTAKIHMRNHASVSAKQPHSNHEAKPKLVARRGFTVIRELKINELEEDLRKPVCEDCQYSLGKSFLCCGDNGIRLQLKIPKSAFVPGENVVLTGELENQSSKRIDKATARIELYVDHFGGNQAGSSARLTREICQGTCAVFVTKKSHARIDHALALPPLAPSTDCFLGDPSFSEGQIPPLLRVSYALIFCVQMPVNNVMETKVPIIIGTEPDERSIQRRPRTMERDPTISRGVGVAVTYREPFWEKKVDCSQPNEQYYCENKDLEHVNKYPFWMGLVNASKLSKRMGSAHARQNL